MVKSIFSLFFNFSFPLLPLFFCLFVRCSWAFLDKEVRTRDNVRNVDFWGMLIFAYFIFLIFLLFFLHTFVMWRWGEVLFVLYLLVFSCSFCSGSYEGLFCKVLSSILFMDEEMKKKIRSGLKRKGKYCLVLFCLHCIYSFMEKRGKRK